MFLITGRYSNFGQAAEKNISNNEKAPKYCGQGAEEYTLHNEEALEYSDAKDDTLCDTYNSFHARQDFSLTSALPTDEEGSVSGDSDDDAVLNADALVVSRSFTDIDGEPIEDEQIDEEAFQDDVEQLTQEDIDNYLENESAAADQTYSQEVRDRHTPHLDMAFDTSSAAQAYFSDYASICGFAVKKASNYRAQRDRTKEETRCIFRCNRAGKVVDDEVQEERKRKRQLKRQEKTGIVPPETTRKRRRNAIEITGCPTKLVVAKRNDKWYICDINLEHNHELSPPEETKFLRSHKHMTDQEKLFVRTFNSVKMPTRKIMAILSYLRKGPLPYTKKYVTNFRASIRKENDKNDMMQTLDFFREKQAADPRFFYRFKVDKKDVNKVLCIFWSDGYSRKQYELYGDCLSFDTTYKTNKYNLPFAPFVGITGHGLNCLFACAIIEDETIDTFVWLFQTFLECMGGKQPCTVITDQDVSMKEAVPAVFSLAVHRNCLFHIMKKAEEKCGKSFATKKDLYDDFSDIVHNSLTVEEFEGLWANMVQKYDIGRVKYFKIMWKHRRRWAPIYFKTSFLPLIQSTSRSEGTNAIFKDNVASNYSVISFLQEYLKISEAMEDKEREQDSITRTTKPTYSLHNEVELQAARMYNRQIFYRFQKQIKFAVNLHVEEIEKGSKYEVYKSSYFAGKDFRSRRYLVLVNLVDEDFACICGKFQKDGIVCAHILRVLYQFNKAVLPEKYYLERWKPKDKKSIRHKQFSVPMELTEKDQHLRYTLLSTSLLELASDGARTNEKYLYVVTEREKIQIGLDEMTKADEIRDLCAKGYICVDENPTELKHPDGYDTLKDPDVVASKGRPRSRFLTMREKILSKQQNKCSHCKSEEHNIATCTNLHLDKTHFEKKAGTRKTKGLHCRPSPLLSAIIKTNYRVLYVQSCIESEFISGFCYNTGAPSTSKQKSGKRACKKKVGDAAVDVEVHGNL